MEIVKVAVLRDEFVNRKLCLKFRLLARSESNWLTNFDELCLNRVFNHCEVNVLCIFESQNMDTILLKEIFKCIFGGTV